jgi:uncharacterized BrkB/YihY/UPF0761 family membrane protein
VEEALGPAGAHGRAADPDRADALGVVVIGPIAEQVVGVGDAAVDVWEIAKWPFLAGVLMLLVALLYWASPNVRHPGWRWVTPGSVLAVALWIVASAGFSFYISNFGSYGAIYGGIGGVLVFLMWLWFTNAAILLGAELDSELERTRAIEAGMTGRQDAVPAAARRRRCTAGAVSGTRCRKRRPLNTARQDERTRQPHR